MLGSFLYPLSYVSSPALKPSNALLQDTLALHVKRRLTPACRLHARTMAPATWTACTSPAVAAQASRGRRVPSSLTSVPSARVLTARAAAWAPATSASVIQVGSYVDSEAFPRRLVSSSLPLSEGHPQSVTYTGVDSCRLAHTYSADSLLGELSTGLCFSPCNPFTFIVRKLESARRQNGETENQPSLVTQCSCPGKAECGSLSPQTINITTSV